jgi:hypothetical protein
VRFPTAEAAQRDRVLALIEKVPLMDPEYVHDGTNEISGHLARILWHSRDRALLETFRNTEDIPQNLTWLRDLLVAWEEGCQFIKLRRGDRGDPCPF